MSVGIGLMESLFQVQCALTEIRDGRANDPHYQPRNRQSEVS